MDSLRTAPKIVANWKMSEHNRIHKICKRHSWCNGYHYRNGHSDPSSNPSQSTNSVGKCMNLTILHPVRGKIVGQSGFFSLGMATGLEGKTRYSNLLNCA